MKSGGGVDGNWANHWWALCVTSPVRVMVRSPSWYLNAFGRHIFSVHNTLQRRLTNKGGGTYADDDEVTYI